MTNTKTTKSAKKANTNETLTKAVTSFDIEAALSAAQSAPKTMRHGVTSELGQKIVELLTKANTELTCSQIFAGLKAGGLTEVNGKPLTVKHVCDKAWNLAKQGKIARAQTGSYKAL